jgi:hypothetical protein
VEDGNPLLVSNSPAFYELLLRQNPFAKKLQTQIASTLKLRKKLSYEKAAHKIFWHLAAKDHVDADSIRGAITFILEKL